jgi:hypothetical protein
MILLSSIVLLMKGVCQLPCTHAWTSASFFSPSSLYPLDGANLPLTPSLTKAA